MSDVPDDADGVGVTSGGLYCVQCPAGKRSAIAGSWACEDCAAGQSSVSGSADCSDCSGDGSARILAATLPPTLPRPALPTTLNLATNPMTNTPSPLPRRHPSHTTLSWKIRGCQRVSELSRVRAGQSRIG